MLVHPRNYGYGDWYSVERNSTGCLLSSFTAGLAHSLGTRGGDMDDDLRDDLRDGVARASFGLVPPKFPNFGLGMQLKSQGIRLQACTVRAFPSQFIEGQLSDSPVP